MSLRKFKSALMICIMGALFSCENSIQTVQKLTSDDTTAAVTAFDINYVRSDSGRIVLILKGPLMIKHDGDSAYTEFPKGFNVDFYDTSGRIVSTMKALYGIRKEQEGLLQAKNAVVVKNLVNQQTLFTDNLIWYEKTRKIKAPGPVKIIGPDRTIFGDSLTANESFTKRTIYGIRGTLDVKDEDAE